MFSSYRIGYLGAITVFVFIFLFGQKLTAQDLKGFDLESSIIPLRDIKDGGPPKDGIPAIDHPKFMAGSKSSLKNNSRILGVFHNGIAKAYPISILNYHEVVNDFFHEVPVVITYCPLCGSGIAFDAKIKGEAKTFGVSGLLYNSDVLLYDRQTESLWSQLMSKSISGPMVGEVLTMLHTENTTWENWKEKHPKTLVLSYETGFDRDYDINPYPNYESSISVFFPVSDRNALFHPKEYVLGIEINGKFKAYPFSELGKSKSGVVHETFQGQSLKIVYDAKHKSTEIFDGSGKPVPSITNFWFAWYAFHPDTEVYQRSPKKN